MRRQLDAVVQNSVAFLLAHEAAHAHVLDVAPEEVVDDVAETILRQRAVYLSTAAISLNARYGKSFNKDLPIYARSMKKCLPPF
jgi:hypothetical protein